VRGSRCIARAEPRISSCEASVRSGSMTRRSHCIRKGRWQSGGWAGILPGAMLTSGQAIGSRTGRRGRARRPRVPCPCQHCGTVRLLNRSAVARGEGRYCSTACYNAVRAVPITGRKECTKCHVIKPVEEFPRRYDRGPLARGPSCIPCTGRANKAARERYRRTPKGVTANRRYQRRSRLAYWGAARGQGRSDEERQEARRAYMREYQRTWRRTERAQQSRHQYLHSDHGKVVQQRYQRSKKGRAAQRRADQKRIASGLHAAHSRTYRARRGESVRIQRRATDAVQRALANGTLTRPAVCSTCGTPCRPHGHHHRGYEHAHRLDVVWLCVRCHKAAHCD
jgi:hypothetical protein